MVQHTKFSSYDGKTSLFSLPNTVKLNNPLLIAGFPGPGLVGSISINYVIKKLEMQQIFCFESEFIVPGVIFMDGKLHHPFRVYSNSEGTICAVVCEAPIMINGLHSVLDALATWAEDIGINDVFVIDGMSIGRVSDTDVNSQVISHSKRNPIILSSDEGKIINSDNNKKDLNIESLIEGSTTFIGGIAGGLLSSCLSHNISCSVIFIPTQSGIPDPDGAALTIELLQNTISSNNFRIDTTELKKQGEEMKHKLSNLIKSIKQQQEQSQLIHDSKQDPIMYS
ncbi:MAG TPA: PAC2 family protein [Nitrososphaeraceae archaeon]|nr:PAC2 family protein [Nitrososphaeraceae archaeon]